MIKGARQAGARRLRFLSLAGCGKRESVMLSAAKRLLYVIENKQNRFFVSLRMTRTGFLISHLAPGRGKAMRAWFREMSARVESRFGMGDRGRLLSAWNGDGGGAWSYTTGNQKVHPSPHYIPKPRGLLE